MYILHVRLQVVLIIKDPPAKSGDARDIQG